MERSAKRMSKSIEVTFYLVRSVSVGREGLTLWTPRVGKGLTRSGGGRRVDRPTAVFQDRLQKWASGYFAERRCDGPTAIAPSCPRDCPDPPNRAILGAMSDAHRVLSWPASISPDFGESDIHVWLAGLDVTRASLASLERTLSPDERQRIARLRAESDRLRATTSRGLLRHILAGYAGKPAAALRFDYGPGGKPELQEVTSSPSLHFNTAHSGDWLLVAVARARPLGVDIERIRPIVRWERVARRAFSAKERLDIEVLAPDERPAAFITGWTRKEACVKAVGEGVWSAFSRFEVSVKPGEPAAVRSVDGEPAAATDWSMFHLEPAPGFVGALAVQGTGWRLRTGTFQSPETAT